ncbi:predicted protein [Naegleria gruberi]|uniref:Predicted protein n=1 Tax=Naegleria gruberi TaxID=5762 RepID=D2VDB3_NAEGR|nr:uncharacterized protein NAEGRDRAFT_48570 [Naegleria gruberi]EFC45202.1 predicted protein [Naegleria gruberi]|eukprot:XP_002677946.1 predicted protein [Naegleria gruberi strain NEG-M]
MNPTTSNVILLKNTIQSKYNKDSGLLLFQIVHHMLFISKELNDFDLQNEKTILHSVHQILNSNKLVAFRIILHFWKKFKKEITNDQVTDEEMRIAFDCYFEKKPIFGECLIAKQGKSWKKLLKDLFALIKPITNAKKKEQDCGDLLKLRDVMNSSNQQEQLSNVVSAHGVIMNDQDKVEYCSEVEKKLLIVSIEEEKAEEKVYQETGDSHSPLMQDADTAQRCSQLEAKMEAIEKHSIDMNFLKDSHLLSEMLHQQQIAELNGKIAHLQTFIEETLTRQQRNFDLMRLICEEPLKLHEETPSSFKLPEQICYCRCHCEHCQGCFKKQH